MLAFASYKKKSDRNLKIAQRMLFRVWIYSHHKSHKILLEFTDSMRKLRRVGELHSFYAAFGFYKFVCPRPPISSVPVTPLYTDLHRYKNKNTLWAEEIRGTLAGNFFGFSTQKLACFCHREHQTVISATIRRRYSSPRDWHHGAQLRVPFIKTLQISWQHGTKRFKDSPQLVPHCAEGR